LDDIIDGLGQSTVELPGGGSIIIEQTEALVAIDVNGGETQNVLAVNLQAVKEIARQIRWRNLSGIIVIDALKMKQRPDKAKVLNALAKATANDPAGVQVFGLTKLGLIEMTRTRRGISISDVLQE
ncbi:MAG: ribonuclease E/G, partial [Alphaproteobacteria bacterium]|nr:ribonuclease E/G [Alphaproteobacteria bacterium]